MISQSLPEIPLEDELVAAGWERRSMLSAERLQEVQAIYLELGLEVLIRKPDRAQFGTNCELCADTACREYRIIYTRVKKR